MAMAARFNPDDGETLSNLGLLLMRANRLDEAEITLRRALAQQPDNADAHNHLAITLAELGRLPEAQASASAALAISPHHERAS
ncbi:tetratricopeptide repeat protein, partial [Acinetobacter baumannii]|nr:tetratricopeptide repeat protein [Acinetobacter baumannii]